MGICSNCCGAGYFGMGSNCRVCNGTGVKALDLEKLCREVWDELTDDYDKHRIHVEEEVGGKDALIRMMKKEYGEMTTKKWLRMRWEEALEKNKNAR